jgi:hypothetical protein
MTTSSIIKLPVPTNFGNGDSLNQGLSWSQGGDIVATTAGNAEFVVIRTRLSLWTAIP